MRTFFVFAAVVLALWTVLWIRLQIRFKYNSGFWCHQPVFHVYDLYYWVTDVGIIRTVLPSRTKYVNLEQINTCEWKEVTQAQSQEITVLVQQNYFRPNEENRYCPLWENIGPYFQSSRSWWSFGYDDQKKTMIGCISSRPMHVSFAVSSPFKPMQVYYVDFLCVHQNWRKKNMAAQLIQTHEYRQAHSTGICVSLFKREDQLTGIVPVTVFKCHCFEIKAISASSSASTSLVRPCVAEGRGEEEFHHFLQRQTTEEPDKWQLVIYPPSLPTLVALVQSNNWCIQTACRHGHIQAAFVFRKTCLTWSRKSEILSCILSIRTKSMSVSDFIAAFYVALSQTLTTMTTTTPFQHLSMEDISDNGCIIQDLLLSQKCQTTCNMAYYFYNFAHRPLASHQCLLLL